MFRTLSPIFVALLLLTAAARPAAAKLVFDHIGTPAETNNNGRLESFTSTGSAGSYSTAATRFTLLEDAVGDTLAAVVWAQGPNGVGQIDWNQVDFFMEVWSVNPGIGPQGNSEHGNVRSDHLAGSPRPISGGSLTTAWGFVAGGTIDTFRIEFDVSDLSFDAGVEYWLAIRTFLNFQGVGRTGAVAFDEIGTVPDCDVWCSNVIDANNPPLDPGPGEGDAADDWMYLCAIGTASLKRWAYALTVTPETLPGDYNGNGTVDAADYTVWRDTLGSASDPRADGTGDDLAGVPDGDVDPWDYDFWKANFGNTLNTGSGGNQTAPAGVPEPTTATFLCVAVFTLLVNRRGDRRAVACLAVVVLLLTVGARPAAAKLVFDHIGTPAETNNNGRLQSLTITDQADSYATAATRFTLSEDAVGDRLAAVVWGEGPFGTGPIDWNEVAFLIQVWNSNPGIGSAPFAQGGNVHTDPHYVGNPGRPLVGGSLTTPWGFAASGTVNTYRIEIDVSDISFQAGVEYWIALRSFLPFETVGEIGLMTFDDTTSVVEESDVWASSAVGATPATTPGPGEGDVVDGWIYLAGIGSAAFKHFAYALTVTPETLPGDYNGNGTVDAADYAVWRNTLGSTTDLAADGTGDDLTGTPDGDVDQWDYDFWKANFGNTPGSGSGVTPPAGVPEPSTLPLLIAVFVSFHGYGGRRFRNPPYFPAIPP